MTRPAVVTQTVILAAGNGSRLATGAPGVPKPLTHVGGIPLLAHALSQARASGCLEAVIVIGHQGARVKAAAERMGCGLQIAFVETSDPASPNGVSLLAAEPVAYGVFFLQMVDHVFGDVVLPRLAATPLAFGEAARVLVDHDPAGIDLDDATKVRLAGDRVTAIGKTLEPWDAIDAGCFILSTQVFDALRRVPPSEQRTVSSGMRQLAQRGMLGFADVGGIEWVDVDTPADMRMAERLVRRESQQVGAAAS